MPSRNQFKTNDEYNEWFREYRNKNRKKLRKYKREYNKKYRKENGYDNEYKWKLNNPEKNRAERLLRYAVRVGLIKRGRCEVCGSRKVHGHHDDYTKPLEVRWLCALHHSEHHRSLLCA